MCGQNLISEQLYCWEKRSANAGAHHRKQETVRFDTQLMQNPKISGVEYQQGKLQGYKFSNTEISHINHYDRTLRILFLISSCNLVGQTI